jgi:hypothetical protein
MSTLTDPEVDLASIADIEPPCSIVARGEPCDRAATHATFARCCDHVGLICSDHLILAMLAPPGVIEFGCHGCGASSSSWSESVRKVLPL